MTKTKKVPADVSSLPDINEWIEDVLSEDDCPMKELMQISMAVEEVFVNIASYAYPAGQGEALIELRTESGEVCIKFTDSGVEFNPLDMEQPDVEDLAASESVGGLGIFMVRKIMDSVSYEYSDGHNVLVFTKKYK